MNIGISTLLITLAIGASLVLLTRRIQRGGGRQPGRSSKAWALMVAVLVIAVGAVSIRTTIRPSMSAQSSEKHGRESHRSDRAFTDASDDGRRRTTRPPDAAEPASEERSSTPKAAATLKSRSRVAGT